MPSDHRIGRLTLDVELHGSETAGFAVQRELSSLCGTAVPAGLAAAFAAYDTRADTLILERVEIDVGSVSLDSLARVLPAQIAARVGERLRELPGSAGSARAGGSALRLSPRRALFEAFAHMLIHGRLPWWYARPDDGLADAVRHALLNAPLDGEERSALAAALREVEASRRRFAEGLPPSVALVLLDALSPELGAALRAALAAVEAPETQDATVSRLRVHVIRAAVEAWRLRELGADSRPRSAIELLRAGKSAVQSEESASPAAPAGRAPARAAVAPREISSEAEGDEAREGLIVANAGVVLLHPFLPRFFAALGLAEDDVLRNPHRAALLLHHLATGAREAEEFDLVLAKLLCGLPLGAVLRRQAPVTAAEAAESFALLEAALRHWGALGSTTPDGLRGNFLVRPGKLQVDEHLALKVEWQSHDVLLERLPWGFGLIRLPWMPSPLHVEWTV